MKQAALKHRTRLADLLPEGKAPATTLPVLGVPLSQPKLPPSLGD